MAGAGRWRRRSTCPPTGSSRRRSPTSLKHAGPAPTTVALHFGDADLCIEVVDDGVGSGALEGVSIAPFPVPAEELRRGAGRPRRSAASSGRHLRPGDRRDAGAGRALRRCARRGASARRRILGDGALPARAVHDVTLRVVIVDDQALVRAGFTMILEAEPDIEVVGEAADGNEAVHVVEQRRPDVVLMDVRMPGLDGIAATRLLAGPGAARPVKVIILTTYDLDEYVFDALAAGASGFLLKDVPPEDLVAGIRRAASGDALLAPSVTRRLIAEFVQLHRPADEPPVRVASAGATALTPRELDVLVELAKGRSNAEIAAALVVSENTVKTHVTHILDKLGLRDRVQAVIYAFEAGLAGPTP